MSARDVSLFAFAAVCTTLLWSDARCVKADGPARPNIILCMADDMGWGDTGYNGHPTIKTPNLDKMSRVGLKFNRFYAGSSVCSPTRGSALTGRHPYRFGVHTANHGHLRDPEISIAELAREHDYATGHFGKWHLGTLSPDFSGKGPRRKPRENYMTPGMQGFDEWFTSEYSIATWDPYKPDNAHGKHDVRALFWHNGKNVADGEAAGLTGCTSRIVMDKAIPFIERAARQEKPFLAVIWFHAPHEPVIGGPAYRAMYPNATEDEKHYFAVVTALDEQMGRLRAKLRELGVADNTMLFFCADNGPEGNPGKVNRRQGSAGPFRGRKRSLYEGGVRVAGLLEWPAMVKKPRETDVPCVTSDYFPTIAAVLGYDMDEKLARPYDGVNLMPLIEGDLTERPRPIGFQYGRQATLMDNRYKLVHNRTDKRLRSDNGSVSVAEWELYDLIEDPSETKNIAAQHSDIVEAMKKQLQSWQASCQRSAEGKDY